ncbi:unnamed protein product [Gongylonema pulchrum]|uniref:EGF-like domain-containing protein n=1 Tax=Gongylonema pulchrum TaxID=637853 RepID=A0A183D7E1_9BILA|nr:unnamed protein product [Gongylonema pulchrum]
MPETLRDLAYRHENEIEEILEQQVTAQPLSTGRDGNDTKVTLPSFSRTTAPWQLRTGKAKDIDHIYDGRFPKISAANLNRELVKTKVMMGSTVQIGKQYSSTHSSAQATFSIEFREVKLCGELLVLKDFNLDKCAENPCQNEARCRLNSTSKAGFSCICQRGWAGPLCESSFSCRFYSSKFLKVLYA